MTEESAPIKLDIGCGPNCKEGFEGIDSIDFGQKHVGNVFDVLAGFADNSVDEIHSSHFMEHLTNLNEKWERVRFFNELYRVMKVDAKAFIIIPHWNSCRYYGDPTHKEPISEFAFYYLDKAWRMANAPHTGHAAGLYSEALDFHAMWVNGMHPELLPYTTARQIHYMAWHKEAIQDLHITLTKR